MVAVAGGVGVLVGLPLGVFLAASRKGELFAAPALNATLGALVNVTRSTPFIILMVAIIPLTRAIVGASIGAAAAIVPLSVAAAPFSARIVEGAIREVDHGLVEAARAMGATPLQTVRTVLIPEEPYLDNQTRDRGYRIEAVAQTVNFPMGVYSRKLKTAAEIKDGAVVAIPNDPTNGGRALLLLQDKGLVKLRPDAGLKATIADIAENSRKLKIVEVDAAQTVRSLDDVDLAAINTNYAIEAKLDPTAALLREEPKGPYVNLIVVRTADKDKAWVKTLVEAYQSAPVKAFVQERFKGAVLTAW
ncbi:MAG: ABC transporter permease subunit [Rhodoblastus sp.]|nr:MAG: ABC transporter permease subunit [Rhodoblastus sp.]